MASSSAPPRQGLEPGGARPSELDAVPEQQSQAGREGRSDGTRGREYLTEAELLHTHNLPEKCSLKAAPVAWSSISSGLMDEGVAGEPI